MTDVSLLLDFYGQLLTERTRSLLELHYEEDMSFSEIAEVENISRQAVHDTVRRGAKSLATYEEKLGLTGRFLRQREMIEVSLAALRGNRAEEAVELLSQLLEQL